MESAFLRDRNSFPRAKFFFELVRPSITYLVTHLLMDVTVFIFFLPIYNLALLAYIGHYLCIFLSVCLSVC